MPSKEPGKLYSIKQIRELYLPGLSYRKVAQMVERGELEAYRVGNKRLVSMRAIEMYMSKLIPEEPAAESQGRTFGRGGE